MKRKYNVNDNYFSSIDTEDRAYWLGFLMADAYINQRSGQDRLILDIAYKDRDHLETYKRHLGFIGPTKEFTIKSGMYQGYKHCSVSITSQVIVNDLDKLGCTPRKSNVLKFPSISDHLINHFIRGYFDGDGSVFRSLEKHWRSGVYSMVIHFRFIGTESFLRDIDKYLGLSGRIVKVWNSQAWELSYKRNKKAKIMYQYLYNNATIFLQRKKDVFESHLQERCSETIIS